MLARHETNNGIIFSRSISAKTNAKGCAHKKSWRAGMGNVTMLVVVIIIFGRATPRQN